MDQFTAVEKALFLGRRRKQYYFRNADISWGHLGESREKSPDMPPAYYEFEAVRTGFSVDQIKKYLAIYSKVGEYYLHKAYNTSLDSFTGLTQLAKCDKAYQRTRLLERAKPRKSRTISNFSIKELV